MTTLDIYVFHALRKAYSNGVLDGIEAAENPYSNDNSFEDVLDEVLFCTEYAELSREQMLHPEEILTAADDEGEPDPESQEPDQDDDKTEPDAELSAEAAE